VLMERAGRGAAAVLRTHFHRTRGPVVVVAGRGNNGGDGFVIARHLRRARMPVEVWLAARPEDLRGDAGRMHAAWQRGGGRTHPVLTSSDVSALSARLVRASVIVDSLLGTGLNGPVTGVPAAVIEAINAAARPVLAVDIASGLSADSGQMLSTAIRATATATFGFAKVGQYVSPGAELSGSLHVVDIGIPPAALAARPVRTALLEAYQVGCLLAPRPRAAHKGTFGHVLVIAGSRGKAGAAMMAAEGAARTGAGLTTLAVPAALQPIVEGHVREVMTEALPDAPDGTAALGDGRALATMLDGKSAVVCGPGLGVRDGTRALVTAVLERTPVPLVLDADGLNAVVGVDHLRDRHGPTVITPHPGEMARLIGAATADIQADRIGIARRAAADRGVVVVLKGAGTVVAAPDGRAAISSTGNPGMASGGMGDVLAGMVGALLAQGLDPFDAAALAVFVHGAAADAVAARRGEAGLLARDVLDEIPPTLARVQDAARAHAPRRRRRDGQ